MKYFLTKGGHQRSLIEDVLIIYTTVAEGFKALELNLIRASLIMFQINSLTTSRSLLDTVLITCLDSKQKSFRERFRLSSALFYLDLV